jgi:hypothetical protein
MLFNQSWDKKPLDFYDAMKFTPPEAFVTMLLPCNLSPGAMNFLSDEALDFFCAPPETFRMRHPLPPPMYVPDGARVAHCLRFAAAVLECSGWCQDTAIDKDGRRCAGEAIAYAAMQDHALRDHAMQAMGRFLNCTSVPAWNDKPGRTKSEVVETFYRVAKLVDRQQVA